MIRFFLFFILFISIPVQAGSAVVKSFRCLNAWHWQIDVSLYDEGRAFLSWSHQEWPNMGTDSRDSIIVEDATKNLSWFRFADGYLVVEKSFTDAEQMSSQARVKFGEQTTSYRCSRI